MALRVPKLVGSKWVYEYPVSAAPAPESNDGSEHNQGKLATDRVGLNLLSNDQDICSPLEQPSMAVCPAVQLCNLLLLACTSAVLLQMRTHVLN